MENCLFCKIARGEIPSEKVYENERIYAFRDINPAAPTHVLIIPKQHISGADELRAEHSSLISELILAANILARELKLDDGWRVVTNVLENGGQTVRHLHFHLLGGGQLGDFGSRAPL
jgi:histidine triad (HIT) family protein